MCAIFGGVWASFVEFQCFFDFIDTRLFILICYLIYENGRLQCVVEHMFVFEEALAQGYSLRVDDRTGTSSDSWVDRYVRRGRNVQHPWTRL